ncbi:hypothetical protein Taro_028846 [Colocasia esculenta]|uniref:RING-type E3 ubiquitin transferase n=1 Tax=Colocasia esculenta TaxID=4460 RepID=A0A843VRJ0_COLES|nr:hypothetical protein [Colocasia esculenta]
MSTPTADWWRPPEKDGYGLHNRIMLSAALALSAVVVLVICLHLYFRYAVRRQRETRRFGNTTLSVPGAMDGPPRDSPSAGLHPSVISSLPTISYKKLLPANAAEESAAAAAAECAVCLCALEEGEVARLLPNCGHLFHVGCIDAWLATRSTCPVCRAEAKPKAPAAPAEPAPPPQKPSPAEATAPAAAAAAAAAAAEGTSGSCKDQEGGAASRLNASMRRMLSVGRSQRRSQTEHVVEDPERQ